MSAPHPEVASTPVEEASKATSVAVLDASVWVSRLLPPDANHAAAKLWTDNFLLGGGLLIVPSIFVVEVTAAISRRTKVVADAYRAGDQILAIPRFQIAAMDTTLMTEARNLAADHGLRAGDAVYAALARVLDIPLVSFDGELCLFATAAGIEAITP